MSRDGGRSEANELHGDESEVVVCPHGLRVRATYGAFESYSDESEILGDSFASVDVSSWLAEEPLQDAIIGFVGRPRGRSRTVGNSPTPPVHRNHADGRGWP